MQKNRAQCAGTVVGHAWEMHVNTSVCMESLSKMKKVHGCVTAMPVTVDQLAICSARGLEQGVKEANANVVMMGGEEICVKSGDVQDMVLIALVMVYVVLKAAAFVTQAGLGVVVTMLFVQKTATCEGSVSLKIFHTVSVSQAILDEPVSTGVRMEQF